ncbi:MAG: Lrp/AsnC family transcriptional regulator [Promethearchaeota archaeon]
MKYDDILEIDETDKEIISILQKNPDTTHSVIAEKVHKSQPAVGARIIKLKRKFLLTETIGANFKKLDLKLARVEISAKNVEELWNKFEKCPYVINCFKMTGIFNLMIELVAPNVRTIDNFVDTCLRKDPIIKDIRVNFVIDSLRQYVIPLNFEIEKYEEHGCNFECGGKLYKKDLNELLNS